MIKSLPYLTAMRIQESPQGYEERVWGYCRNTPGEFCKSRPARSICADSRVAIVANIMLLGSPVILKNYQSLIIAITSAEIEFGGPLVHSFLYCAPKQMHRGAQRVEFRIT